MRQLSAISGGRLRFGGDAGSIRDVISNLSLELQRQYLLGFSVPENSLKGEYHKVQVKLNTQQPGLKGLRARVRESYLVD